MLPPETWADIEKNADSNPQPVVCQAETSTTSLPRSELDKKDKHLFYETCQEG